MRQKPSVFIGSSTEGLAIALEVQFQLKDWAYTTIWKDGVFTPGSGYLEILADQVGRYDFAVMILSPDDLLESRNQSYSSPRDNVIFELGLFMGCLGRKRTFIIHASGENLKLPSDFNGIVVAPYDVHEHNNLTTALSVTCTPIIRQILKLGFFDLNLEKGKNNKANAKTSVEKNNLLNVNVSENLTNNYPIGEENSIDNSRAQNSDSVVANRIVEEHLRWLSTNGSSGEKGDFNKLDLSLCIFKHRNLSSASFGGAKLYRVNFESSNLSNAYFSESDLGFADLRSADLKWANFSFATLYAADATCADFSGADLYETIFEKSRLINANFNDAYVTFANFTGADISGANFINTRGLTGGTICVAANIDQAVFAENFWKNILRGETEDSADVQNKVTQKLSLFNDECLRDKFKLEESDIQNIRNHSPINRKASPLS